MVRSHKDLIAWQKAMRLAADCYRLAKLMPRNEEYRLISQLLRSVASVPANIAEGHARGTRRDYANFVAIARGSLAEAETFLLLAIDVDLIPAAEASHSMALIEEVGRMLNALHSRLKDGSKA